MKTESQKQIIKRILDDGEKHCSTEFTDVMKIIDYRARISSIRRDLKEEGKTVHSEPCRGKCGKTHDAPVFRYWIGSLYNIVQRLNNMIPPSSECCPGYRIFKEHNRDCKSLIKQTNKTLF